MSGHTNEDFITYTILKHYVIAEMDQTNGSEEVGGAVPAPPLAELHQWNMNPAESHQE